MSSGRKRTFLMAASLSALIATAAHAQQAYHVQLPVGTLSDSLRALGSQTGSNILVDAKVGAIPARAIDGQMTVREALDQLTKGKGVHIRAIDQRSFLVALAQPLLKKTASTVGVVTAAGEAAAAPSSSGTVVQEVVVTSSRVIRNGYSAPTPTTVLNSAEIEKSAPANIADYVNELPQLQGSFTPQSTGTISGAIGGANILNLRALGAPRTLVLLDGRRVVGATPTGGVDINLFPASLVSRVDVVTGGASAQWGSDAVSGVVNFLLDTKYVGFKGQLEGGLTERQDGANEKISLTYGTTFGNGRGHAVASALYAKIDGIPQVNSRPWYNSTKMVPNPAWADGNGQPYYVILPRVGIATATDGGLITAVTGAPVGLVGTNFGPNGTTSRFVFGQHTGGNAQVGGTYSIDNDNSGKESLIPGNEQSQVFLHGGYDLTDKLSAVAEFSYAKSDTSYYGGASPQGTGLTNPAITIRSDNAYLPAAIAAQMPAGSSFTLGRLNYDAFLTQPVNVRETTRYMAGLNGTFGSDWKWSAYAQFGRTASSINVLNDAIPARLPLAADAVLVTAANVGSSGLALGSIACRSTLTAPTNGCAPENVFGYGSPSRASLNYLTGHAHQSLILKEQVYAVQLNGVPFSTWAGAVAAAAGAEYRTESIFGDADALSQTNAFNFGNYKPLAGSYTVAEGFVEADVPLLRDAPLAKSIAVDGAVRYTNYSVSGSVTTWKVGLNWDLNDDLRIRATRSRDIRAPNLNELFQTGQVRQTNLVDPARNNISSSILETTKGNLNLRPEVADSWGVGAVFRPTLLPGFGASIDYYNVSIDDAIATLASATVVLYCFQGQSFYCSSATRNAAGVITAVSSQPFNANSETEKGVDIEVSYRTALERFSLPGDLSLRILANNVQERKITAGGVVTNFLDEIALNGAPGPARWRFMVNATHIRGPSTLSLTARYIGHGVVDNTFVQGGNARLLSIDNNRIESFTTYHLSEILDLEKWTGRNLRAYAVIQNLTDAKPPVAVANNVNFASLGTQQATYDLVGRQYRIGLRFAF